LCNKLDLFALRLELFSLRLKFFGLRTELFRLQLNFFGLREALFTLRLELFALRAGRFGLRERFSGLRKLLLWYPLGFCINKTTRIDARRPHVNRQSARRAFLTRHAHLYVRRAKRPLWITRHKSVIAGGHSLEREVPIVPCLCSCHEPMTFLGK
jgi:hypothetical protein